MDEKAAREVTLVRAIETADRARTVWSDADRAWASRAAAEVVGESSPPLAFLARRASLALERMGERHAWLRRAARAFEWRGWITPIVLAIAFVAGVAVDEIGAGRHVNILAPPVLGLLAWNLAVYALLAIRASGALWRGRRAPPGPLRKAIARMAGATAAPASAASGPLASGLAAFAADWSRLAWPLYAARVARILHLGAALFAAGVIAGMYLRGIALEYLASWQSTFLGPAEVRRLLAIALAPGSALTGIAIPDVAHIEAIRASATNAGENAAPWLHLYAATVGALVVVPRLALALVDSALAAWRRTRVPVALDEPYFARLLRGFSGRAPRVHVIPYSYGVPPGASRSLQDVLARGFGARTQVTLGPAVGYGEEDALDERAIPAEASALVALFNATATPESESQGAFVSRLAALGGPARELFALVDESAFRARWPGDARRIAQRCEAWRDVLGARRVPVLCVDLASPDLAGVEALFDRALP